MHLTQREQEKLLVYLAAQLARARQARGLKRNYPEALAILSAEIMEEGAREGRSVVELMAAGKQFLTEDDVLPGVAELIVEDRADGELLVCDPATELPMARRYFLF